MKKTIPLDILESVQSAIDKNSDIIKAIKDDLALVHLIDKDKNSDFYFKILMGVKEKSSTKWTIEYKPLNTNTLNDVVLHLKFSDVIQSLENWVGYIKSYNELHTVFDDPILKQYEDDFASQFHFTDDMANQSSFNLNQQIFLDDYLTKAINKIERLQDENPKKQKDLEELKKDAEAIRINLTIQSKKETAKGLAKFWAKAQKLGLDIIKEIFVDVAAELTKKLLTGG